MEVEDDVKPFCTSQSPSQTTNTSIKVAFIDFSLLITSRHYITDKSGLAIFIRSMQGCSYNLNAVILPHFKTKGLKFETTLTQRWYV